MRLVLLTSILALASISAISQEDNGDGSANDAIRESAQRIADKGYERSGAAVKEMLMAAGLSPQDSERVAKTYMDGLVSCLLDAAQSEADKQSVPFEDVLLAFEQAMDDPEIDEPTVVDMRRVDDSAQSCVLTEMQKAGVSVELIIEHQKEAAGRPPLR